jgi:glycerophosphoryl diester phosphodiesterase
MIPIIAHRTCPLDAPENSIAGIRKAADLGADGVEIDVRRSLGGTPLLLHDWSPRRTAGLPGPIRMYPMSLLRKLRLQGSEERLPALEEALASLPDGLSMAVEIKDATAARRTLEVIRTQQKESRVLMWAYREAAVRYFAKHAPEIESSLLRDDTDPDGLMRFLLDAVSFGARGISAHWTAINPQFVASAHERGLKVYSWIRDLDSVAKKVSYGMDGIVTDQPRDVRTILERIVPTGTEPRVISV